MPIINPLTEEHCQCIERVLRSLPDLKDTAQCYEECGLDMSERKALLEAQEQFAARVKQLLMPGR